MSTIIVRPAAFSDLTAITEIYNYYVINTAITFVIDPLTVEEHAPWFHAHTEGGRYQLFVAEDRGQILGFAGSGRFRPRAAYGTTVETSIYCAHQNIRAGIGTMLYAALFDAIKREDVNRIVAGITLPNDASLALHKHFGFTPVGTFSQVGRKFGRYWDVLWMERPRALGM